MVYAWIMCFYVTLSISIFWLFLAAVCTVIWPDVYLNEFYTLLDAVWGAEACDGMIMLTFWSVFMYVYSVFSESVVYCDLCSVFFTCILAFVLIHYCVWIIFYAVFNCQYDQHGRYSQCVLFNVCCCSFLIFFYHFVLEYLLCFITFLCHFIWYVSICRYLWAHMGLIDSVHDILQHASRDPLSKPSLR